MKRKLVIERVVSPGVYIGVSPLKKRVELMTDKKIKRGDFVSVINGVVVSLAKPEKYTVHEV